MGNISSVRDDISLREPAVERWSSLAEAAHVVGVPVSLIEQWVNEGRVAAHRDPTTNTLLIAVDDVEDLAEEAALRRLSQKALAHDDRE